MKQRGKRSSAQLSVVAQGKPVETVERPKPLRELTPEQSGVWRETVDALPADWFPPETLNLLAMYCRHVVSVRRIGELIEGNLGNEEFGIDGYDRLLKMQEREGRAASSLATRMRLTQQATFDKEKSKGKGRGIKRPWDQ